MIKIFAIRKSEIRLLCSIYIYIYIYMCVCVCVYTRTTRDFFSTLQQVQWKGTKITKIESEIDRRNVHICIYAYIDYIF